MLSWAMAHLQLIGYLFELTLKVIKTETLIFWPLPFLTFRTSKASEIQEWDKREWNVKSLHVTMIIVLWDCEEDYYRDWLTLSILMLLSNSGALIQLNFIAIKFH